MFLILERFIFSQICIYKDHFTLVKVNTNLK